MLSIVCLSIMIVYLTTVIKGILLTLLWFLKIYFLTSHECCLKNMLMFAMICWFLLCYFINWKNFSVMSFKFLRKSKMSVSLDGVKFNHGKTNFYHDWLLYPLWIWVSDIRLNIWNPQPRILTFGWRFESGFVD